MPFVSDSPCFVLQSSSGVSLEEYDIADNMDLMIVVQAPTLTQG